MHTLHLSQALLLPLVNCQLELTYKLVESKASKEVLTSCLDGLLLAMTANYACPGHRLWAWVIICVGFFFFVLFFLH